MDAKTENKRLKIENKVLYNLVDELEAKIFKLIKILKTTLDAESDPWIVEIIEQALAKEDSHVCKHDGSGYGK